MDKRKKTKLQILIVSIAVVLLAHVWPFGYVRHHEVSSCQGEETIRVALTKEHHMIQHIMFEQEYIDALTCYLSVVDYSPYALVEFRLYNEKFACIYSELVRCELLERDEKVEIPLKMEVEPGKNYFFEWVVLPEHPNTPETIVSVPLTQRNTTEQKENLVLFLDGNGENNLFYMVDYDYSRSFKTSEICIIFLCIVLGAITTYFFLFKLLCLKVWNSEKVKTICKIILSLMSLIVFFILQYNSVIKGIFGNEILDRIVYSIGICCMLFWILSAIWVPSKERTQDFSAKNMWVDWLQVVIIAYAMISACRYVNAIALKTQITNQNRITYCLIVLLLSMPILKKSLDFRNFWRRINWLTLLPWIVFMIPVIQNRFDKNWTWMLVLFTPFVLFKLEHEEQMRFLHNFENGIYISYLLTTIYSLLYRPYNGWGLARYSGMFHTVAYTGMYLSVVVAVSFGKILTQYLIEKKRRLLGLDIFVLSTSLAYVLLSITRTAILAIGVAAFLAFLLAIWIYKVDLKSFLKRSVFVLGICIFSFFMVFSLTRMIPAIINEPHYLEIETLGGAEVGKGEKLDSPKYMSFSRYLSLFFGRFGGETAKNEVTNAEVLLVSNQIFLPATIAAQTGEEVKSDLSNGRFNIFRAYLKTIGWESHEDYATIDPDTGIEYGHAHNAFLQISYLFGLFAGIMFLIVCGLSWITSIYYLVKNKQSKEAMLPFLMVTIFGITSMVEWTFNPCNPIGFAFLFVQTVLMQRAVEAKPKK